MKTVSDCSPSDPQDESMLRVVVADDSDLLRDALVQVIEEIDGVEIVGEAVHTQSAIELVAAQAPDILILDLRMPGGGGVPVLDAAKQLQPPPIVIVFSAYDHEPYRRRCIEAGADYFFMKTRDNHRLLETLLALREAHRTGMGAAPIQDS